MIKSYDFKNLPSEQPVTKKDTKVDLTGKLSVVIITRNRVQFLINTLNKLLSLSETFPVTVIDNNSQDNTARKVMKLYPKVKVIGLKTNLGAAARNIGVYLAQTPYVAFCDDDSWWDDQVLSKAADILDKYPTVGLIQSKVQLLDKGIDPACKQMLKNKTGNNLPGPSVSGFTAGGAIVRKEAFLQTSGFWEQFGVGGEEELLAIDLKQKGWNLVFVNDIVSFHDPSPVRVKGERKQIIVRNHLWTVWLRKPFWEAFAETLKSFGAEIFKIDGLLGFTKFLDSISWVLEERRKYYGVSKP